ncbi:NAD(P)/FAD-dependent oxidoreductase [Saccharopolyspora sp. 5N708]|uniref:NAD(P)/FAD-dependent oxidoreductase n=1 Tax=Saccharopolyspora sp. 5N708 TaxID=3457424 RepID=UPI003FD37570
MSPVLHGGPVVVIGGGVIGASVAFHLAERGYRDVTVLERGLIGEGATAHATGGIRQQFTSEVNVQLVRDSVEFFTHFEQRTGAPLTFRQHGYLFLLTDERQLTAFTAAAEMQRGHGVPAELLTPRDVRRLNPQIRVDDLLGAAYCATDGSASPHDAVQGFAKAARARGVRIRQHTEAVAIETSGGAVSGVRTATGERLAAELVLIATGPQARETGRLAGVELPVGPHRRQAFAIDALPWLSPDQPLTVDLGSGAYLHPETGGAVIGGNDRDVPEGTDTAVDWSLTEPLIEALVHRFPAMAEAAIVRGWAGLREMTPDDHAIVGPLAVPGLWAAAGFSGHGFMQSPAIGDQLARWLLDGSPAIDLSALRIERFSTDQLAVEGVRF